MGEIYSDLAQAVAPTKGRVGCWDGILDLMSHQLPGAIRRSASFPDGHFYSPVVDPQDLIARETALWPAEPSVLGIDFNDAAHRHILEEEFPRFIGDFGYAEEAPAEDQTLDQFYVKNSQFSWLDARALFVLLRAWRPGRIVEVGSGYSSLLMADVNRRFLDGRCQVTCIEPYPRPFLTRGIAGLGRVIQEKAQDVPLSEFADLAAGDVLFIDSSHVAKTGSDVNFLFLEVLPRLQPGVRVHVHDIFLPHDYPKDWAITMNRSWNEQYLLRALLMYSTAFRPVFSSAYAYHRFPEAVRAALGLASGRSFGGSSFWMERCS
jgi:predicted O-methyltransferase YrrM